jgi:hypothetical protein
MVSEGGGWCLRVVDGVGSGGGCLGLLQVSGKGAELTATGFSWSE